MSSPNDPDAAADFAPGSWNRDKWRHVLLYGVLGWGYPVGMIVHSVDLFAWPPSLHVPADSFVEGGLLLGVWTVAGVLFGLWTWDRARAS
jgi:hypothetical protein